MRLVHVGDKRTADAHGQVRSLTHREIAPLLGISRARVLQLEQRAIRRMRDFVRREAEAEGLTVREWLFGDES